MSNPRRKKYEVDYRAFDGGLNTTIKQVGMPANQTPDIKNMVFSDQGAIETGPGLTLFGAQLTGVSNIQGFEYFRAGGTFFAVGDGYIYKLTAYTWAKVDPTQYFSGFGEVHINEVNEVLLFSQNGFSTVAYDNVDGMMTPYGVTPPVLSSPVTLTPQNIGGGALVGRYKYAITYTNSRGSESDYTEIPGAVNLGTASDILITGLPIPTEVGVSKKTLYRSKDNTLYFKVEDITDITITSYYDNLPESELITEAPADNAIVRKVQSIISYKGRSYAIGDDTHPDYLYWSNTYNQEIFPAENFLQVGDGDGVPIKAIAPLGSTMLIFRADEQGYQDVWVMYIGTSQGVDNINSWYLVKASADEAAHGQHTTETYSNLLFYINRNGAYAFSADGQQITAAADSAIGKYITKSLAADIAPTLKEINWRAPVQTRRFDNKIYVAHTDNLSNRRILVFDYYTATDQTNITGAWSVLYLDLLYMTRYKNKLMGIASDGTMVYLNSNIKTVRGSNQDKTFQFSPITGNKEHRDNYKIFRHINIIHRCEPSGELQVKYSVDNKPGTEDIKIIPLSCGNSSIYGASIFGTSAFGSTSTIKRTRVTLSNAVGRHLDVALIQDASDGYRYKIYEAMIDYNLKSIRR